MGQRVPVPVLREERQAHDGRNVRVSRHGLGPDVAVASAAVDNARGQARAELGHDVLVLVADLLGEQLAHLIDSRLLGLRRLDEDHGQRDEGSLPHEIHGVVGQRLEQVHSSLMMMEGISFIGSCPNVRQERCDVP